MHTHKLTQTTKSTCTRGLSECHMVRYSPFHSLSISNSSNAISVATDTEDKTISELETLLGSSLAGQTLTSPRKRVWPARLSRVQTMATHNLVVPIERPSIVLVSSLLCYGHWARY